MYDERYKDLIVEKIVVVNDGHQVEVYGKKLDGEPTWLLLHQVDKAEVKRDWSVD